MNSFKKSLIVLSLVASSNANALGIGDIHLKSALNQNLNAEVSLVLAEDEKLTDVKVNLAPSAKFDELGIPWTQFLSSIKLQTIEKSNGHVVVKITSNEALKEPFLNFLLQVRSPKSNVFREFTVLVDPPEMQPERAVQKITPRVLPTTIDKPVLQKQPPKIVKPKTTVDTTVKPKKPKQSLELVAPSQENATKLNKSDTEQSVINQTLLNKIVELEKQIAQMQQLLQANKTLPEQPSIEKTPAVPVVEPVAPPVANSTAQSLIIVEPPPLTINEQVTANPEETVSESKPNKHRRTSTTKNSDDSFYYQAGGVTFGLLGLFWAWSRYKKPQILDKKEKIETVDSPSLKQETVEKSNEFVMPEGFIVEDNEAVNNKVFDTFQKDDFEDLKQDEIDPITYKIDIACAYNNFIP